MLTPTRTPRPLARDYTGMSIARRHIKLFLKLEAARIAAKGARHAHA